MLFEILFYIFAGLTIYSAIRVASARNTITAVFHLILVFVVVSCLWMLLQAEFLAMTLIIIYCGAVMVFFLFAVMMLDIPEEVLKSAGSKKYIAVGSLVAIVVVLEIIAITTGTESLLRNPESFHVVVGAEVETQFNNNPKDLGYILFTEYLYSFEVTGVILLVSMIAAISLARRIGPMKRKDVDASWQVKQRAKDRLKLVSMPVAQMASYTPKLLSEEEAADMADEGLVTESSQTHKQEGGE